MAKGSTKSWERRFQADTILRIAHSRGGRQVVETMTKFLRWVRRHAVRVEDAPRIFLLLGSYGVHSCDAVAKKAEELGIEMVLIPAGLTDQARPLDRCVFGEFKAIQRAV